MFDLQQHLVRQMVFSRATFGPGERTKGVIDHIRKELIEIEQADDRAEEWVDVVILALDVAQHRGRDPVDAPEVEAADSLGGVRQNIGCDLVVGAEPAPERPAPDGVEAGPECQQQKRQGTVGHGPVALRRPDERGEDQVLLARIALGAMQPVKQGRRIPEGFERFPHTPDSVETALEAEGGRGMHEVITDLVPCEGHRTPALRPGVQRLLVARSGRRASLRFQGVG